LSASGCPLRLILIAGHGGSAAPVRVMHLDRPPRMPKRRLRERMPVVHVDPDPVRETEDIDLLIGATRTERGLRGNALGSATYLRSPL
jgi:hypothetical protein